MPHTKPYQHTRRVTQTIAAAARELSGFVWAIGRQVQASVWQGLDAAVTRFDQGQRLSPVRQPLWLAKVAADLEQQVANAQCRHSGWKKQSEFATRLPA